MIKQIVAAYLIFINIWGFVLMKMDKKRAQKGKWRISEKTLWLISFLGGAPGMTIGMWWFRHKTKHFAFKYGFPILAFLDVFLFYFMLGRLS
ncbi:DUF1294 domain-containing protein [Lederbergia sp. NSJ-179]|uniref:DUF1294 domain-containing protein n=1 Tax=Lederbergia sp. NSJ-179 TaxID=2931402 RepID=UPI001FD0C453|nr:DUF1294 domain-containing protein [Lederbergia sp. NSJ-179]MCJ7839800.1 DUF1294 domain-containing protein [Lederbergia sp. NSJ-179]